VTDYDHTIGREVDIQLQPVGTGRNPTFERSHGVFRAERATAAVCKHTWTKRAAEKRHTGTIAPQGFGKC